MDVTSLIQHSGIYQGMVRHRRFSPRLHEFRYQVFMMYLDLDELDSVLSLSPWWSAKPWHLARFNRADYFGDAQRPLKTCVLEKVNETLGTSLQRCACSPTAAISGSLLTPSLSTTALMNMSN